MSAQAAPVPPLWDHPRSGVAARLMVEVGAAHGLTPEACLAGSGVDPAALVEPGTIVEASQELTIARNLQRLVGGAGLGLEAGMRYRFSSFGVWGFAIMSSASVRELVRLGVRYSPLSFAFIRPFVEEDREELRVVLAEDEIPADVRDFFVERELAKLALLVPVGIGSTEGIRFETAFDGERADAFRRSFPDVDIRVGAGRHVLALKREILDRPIPQADPVVARELESQCAELLELRVSRRGVAARVRERILADLADPPTLEETAGALHVDPRTLRRQLAAEGTSYRELTAEVRSTMAEELLSRAGLTVAEVARRLGYHDAAGFTRAYKRWAGRTPGQAGSRA